MSYTGKKQKNWLQDWFSVDMIAKNALVAALYFVLTIVSYPLAYNLVQFRISEILNLLVFFNPAYTLGLTLGCFLANTLSTSPWDMLIGTGATLLGCLLMIPFRQLFIAGLMPCLANGAVVGLELYYLFGYGPATPFWVCFGWVTLGEVVVINGVGYAIFMALRYLYPPVMKMIGAKRNQSFVW